MNEYEVKFCTGATKNFTGTSESDVIRQLNYVERSYLESLTLLRRGVVHHDLSSGTSES